MKKYFLYGLGAVMGLALTACDDYKEPNPPAQYNPQESVLQTSSVTVSNLLGSDTYSLEALNEAGELIKAATISCDELPAGYTFGAVAYISNNDFESSAAVDTEVVKDEEANVWTIEITPEVLQNAFYNNIAKTGDETTLSIRYLVCTVYGDQVAIVGGPEYFFCTSTFSILPYPLQGASQLYTPGDANGWNQGASLRLITDNFVNYYGYAVLGPGGFKFSTQDNWDGINYGAGAADGELDTAGDAGNLSVPTLGLYWCDVNISALTYTATYIQTIGVVGDATPGGWDASTALTPSADFTVWSGDVTLTDGEFKFRANDGWDVNLGGTYDNLVQGGANLPSPGAGTYTVTLNLGTIPYSCTLVSK